MSDAQITLTGSEQLSDPEKLFNASFGGKQRRAIDIYQTDKFKIDAFKALIHQAIAFNVAKTKT